MTDVDPNDELISKYINGFVWSPEATNYTRTLVVGNIRAFYYWSKENLVNERADRLEAMIDRMAGTIVELREELSKHIDLREFDKRGVKSQKETDK